MNTEHNGPAEVAEAADTETTLALMRTVEIWGDGACSGIPDPGVGARSCVSDKGIKRGDVRRRASHHEQPHGDRWQQSGRWNG